MKSARTPNGQGSSATAHELKKAPTEEVPGQSLGSTSRCNTRWAEANLTAYVEFTQAHWRKMRSTQPIERLSREVKRRTDVALLRLWPGCAAGLKRVVAPNLDTRET